MFIAYSVAIYCPKLSLSAVTFERPISDHRRYSPEKLATQLFRCLPNDMIIIPRVEMNFAQRIFSTREYDVNIQPMRDPAS